MRKRVAQGNFRLHSGQQCSNSSRSVNHFLPRRPRSSPYPCRRRTRWQIGTGTWLGKTSRWQCTFGLLSGFSGAGVLLLSSVSTVHVMPCLQPTSSLSFSHRFIFFLRSQQGCFSAVLGGHRCAVSVLGRGGVPTSIQNFALNCTLVKTDASDHDQGGSYQRLVGVLHRNVGSFVKDRGFDVFEWSHFASFFPYLFSIFVLATGSWPHSIVTGFALMSISIQMAFSVCAWECSLEPLRTRDRQRQTDTHRNRNRNTHTQNTPHNTQRTTPQHNAPHNAIENTAPNAAHKFLKCKTCVDVKWTGALEHSR